MDWFVVDLRMEVDKHSYVDERLEIFGFCNDVD